MNAYPNRVLSYPFLAALMLILCAAPFVGSLPAQSSSAPAPTVLHALPDGDARAESVAANSGGHWLDHRTLVDPSPDVKCAIVEWTTASPKPSLVVVCPPDEVFAPLRLYFKLSWKRGEDVPAAFQIVAQPKAMIKLHWNSQGDYQVLLPTERKNQRNPHSEWVNFNNLIGVYIKNEQGSGK